MNLEDLDNTEFMTVAEVATFLRVSKMTVYRLCNSGELASVRAGRSFRVTKGALLEYINKGGEK